MKFHASARKCFKIIRNRGSKIHGLSTDRVAESQPTRVESLSFYKPVIRIVKIVSGKRVADVVHMNPDLMRTSRDQPNLKKCYPPIVSKRLIDGLYWLCIFLFLPVNGYFIQLCIFI